MPGSSTKSKFRTRDSVGYNSLSILPFDAVATATSQTAGTIQARIVLPVSCKIYGAMIDQTSTTMVTTGTSSFNVVAGAGTYVTSAGARATDFGTVAGTVHTGDTINLLFSVPNSLLVAVGAASIQTGVLGYPPVANAQQIPFSYTVQSTDTTAAITAKSICYSFNSQQNLVLNDIIFANCTGSTGVVNFTAVEAGTVANSIGLTSSVTGTSATTTFAINAASFASGTATTGTVIGVNDQFEYTGVYNFAPASYLAGALSATPIFNNDMPIFNGHGIQGNVNGSPGNNIYWADNFDVIYQQGTLMTLRLVTPATGPAAVKCSLLYVPFDIIPSKDGFTSFDPNNHIG